MLIAGLAAGILCAGQCAGENRITLSSEIKEIGKYARIEFVIGVEAEYQNPFDPEEIDLTIAFKDPAGNTYSLPVFFMQDYERRSFQRGGKSQGWYYPVGAGRWKGRFAPTETGKWSATAQLKDRNGTIRSNTVGFDCKPSASKGFVRAGRSDKRFFEFTEGEPFFPIGQNLAFVGEGQYVNLSKAEQIFKTLADNGANFLRIWTCCQDWAMAIEARKSAWFRSWSRKSGLIVPMPGSENNANPRKCIKIEGDEGTSITVSPSHRVALRPATGYVMSGRFRAEGSTDLRIRVGNGDWRFPFNPAPTKQWQEFRVEFAAGENEWWLPRTTVASTGKGVVWLDGLSLQEASGKAELLWEADVNRPIRGAYNQLDCYMLDKLVESAQQNGIYLMLCLITRDVYMKSLSSLDSDEYRLATADAKKLMRYAVARWGCSTSIAAWEYFNEMNPGLPTDRFYDDVGTYLEQIDIYKHLKTTSTWHPSAKDCHHDRIDIGQLHHYMRPGTKEDSSDEVAVIIDKAQFLRKHAPLKPVLIGEFGLATPKWGLSDYMKQDTDATHFHTSLWASAFSGVSGTAMFWWWDQLDRQNAYGNYRALADYMAGVSFAGLDPVNATASSQQIRILGCQGADRAYIWLFNTEATWWNLVENKNNPDKIGNATVRIHDLAPGKYNIEWWYTTEGISVFRDNTMLRQGPLSIPVPPFTKDIACKIKRL